MFNSGLAETNQQEVVMQGVNGYALESLVSYMYSGTNLEHILALVLTLK